MTTVRNILQEKGLDVWSVSPETPVLDAVNLMFEKNVGALVIIDNNTVVGIFSERDIARKLIPMETSTHDAVVRDIMARNVISVVPEQTVDECMALMTSKKIRHLPVLDEQKIVGIISIGDLVKAVTTERQKLLGDLKNYSAPRR
jgi:CBS domain-containing protein